jgi:hypothetical protein
MEVAAQHAEGERVGAGQRVEEGLLLHRIALQCGDVASGDQQPATLVEAHPADAPPALPNEAAVPAGDAAECAVGKGLDQAPFHRVGVDMGGEGVGHVYANQFAYLATPAGSSCTTLVPSTSKNFASQAGCAGQAGAVTRFPSTTASSIAMLAYSPPASFTSGPTAG